ncbi:MAG: putative toxin-antitoxin system toxin component, PIN family [archaeon]
MNWSTTFGMRVRAVLDTNILVSAVLVKEGAPAAIIERLIAGQFINCITAPIIGELNDVFSRPKVRLRVWMKRVSNNY